MVDILDIKNIIKDPLIPLTYNDIFQPDQSVFTGADSENPVAPQSSQPTTKNEQVVEGTLRVVDGYIGGAQGWKIKAGLLQSEGIGLATVKGDPTWAFWAGNDSPASAEFRVSHTGDLVATSATITGSITATSGRIANWYINTNTLSSGAVEASSNVLIDSANSLIRLGPTSGNYITLDGTNLRIRSSNYSAGVAGFTVEPTLIEAENLIARGSLRGATFKYDVISAVGGQLLVANADVLASDMTALDNSVLTPKGDVTFSLNDILDIRAVTTSGIQEEFMRIDAVGSGATNTLNTLSGTGANDASIGSDAWSNPSRITAADGSLATALIAVSPTNYLKGTNFGFTIPTGATITGIEVTINRKTNSGVSGTEVDNRVSIVKSNGSIGTTNKANIVPWPTALTDRTYGGSSDLWGETWTASDINNSNFGVVLSAQSLLPPQTVSVDYFKIKIYYTIASGSYSVVRDLAGSYSANSNPAWQAGTPVTVIGSSDGASAYSGGYLRLLGAGTNAPHYSVFSRTGVAYNAITERIRLGNLNGIGGKVADTYGIFIGDYTNFKYLLYDDVSGDFIISSQKIVQPFTAGFALTAGQAVCIYTDGKVYPTNAQVSTASSFIGFCLTTTAKDALAPIQVFGNFTSLSGLSLTNIPPIYYLSDGTHTSDQANTTGATEFQFTDPSVGGGATDTVWQSFTTGNGVENISKITLRTRNAQPSDQTITVSILIGEGTGGAQVGTSKVLTIGAAGGQADRDVIFDVPITVSANTQYTIKAVGSYVALGAGCSWYYDAGGNPYAGGRASTGANDDFRFASYKINSYGAIGTSAGTVSKKVGLATSSTSLTLKDSI